MISLGGVLESIHSHGWGSATGSAWVILLLVSSCAWGWYVAGQTARAALARLHAVVMGRPLPRPATDPKALAAEVAALNAQIAQLRDTATSFDLSFDQTLQRLDERLRRLEQQSLYVQVGHRAQ